ncbi:oligosaccharide flippase family protein [Pseudoalteromonas arctica]|uniref:Polysaccharide transporter, PST family n=1 Tax=Pseudoalteromonas arctica A 37-1-2 TaxID=1117313 RepID=A0A290RYV4_9GAMM|nr:oligosaccharide flippase family protein [Pseudoalteromonas arctica]ATC85296.1 polysaccharide transporter, PST family [Pseudoalteromonas arctica A 37-1-2]
MRLISLLKTKDGKVLIENFLSLSVLQIVTMLLPLITLPYVLCVLGYENYGLIALATALIIYFQAIVDYSFKVTAVRDVATHRNSPNKLNLIYSRVMIIKLAFLLLSLATIMLIVSLYPPFYKEKELFLYASLSLVGFALFPEWFFQGIEKMKYITLINVVIKIFFTLSIFIFIKEKGDYAFYSLLASAGVLFSGVIGQWILYKKYKIKFIAPPLKSIKKIIIKNFPIFINQFVPNLYNNSTSLLLGLFVNIETLGIYSAIRIIIDLCVMLLSIVSRVFFPFINRKKDAFKMYRNLMFILVTFGLLILFASSNLIFWYLNLNHPLALPTFLLMGLSILGFVAYDIYGLNYFIIKRQDKLVMKNTIFCSLIAFAFSLPLIYFYGIIGASLTLVIGRFLMGGTLMYQYVKVKKY